MKKSIKFISVILCLGCILSLLAACGDSGNNKPETSTDTVAESEESSLPFIEETDIDTTVSEDKDEDNEGETYETEMVDELVCFVDYVRDSSRSYYDMKSRGDVAMSFKIPDGYLSKLYLNLSDIQGFTPCSISVNIYVLEGSYKSTVATEPIYSEYITSTPRTYNIYFEEGFLSAGEYLVVLSYVEPEISTESESETFSEEESDTAIETDTDGTETADEKDDTVNEPEIVYHSKVIQDNFWYALTIPEEYVKYELKSYMDGRSNKKSAFCGGFEVVYPQIKAEDNEETDSAVDDNEELEEDIAKVILIGGQSNATGASRAPFLKENVSAEKYEEYVNGYSNVKILYSSGALNQGGINIPNKITEFVDCKLGQGIGSNAFGPELGLAAYLSATYPDETFYIIKYAIGGSGLRAHWNVTDEDKDSCLEGFRETVDLGLDILEDEGLDPRIIAFLWMQGESDASTANSSYNYYNLQKALVEDLRYDYAFYEPIGGIAFIDAAVSEEGIWSTAFLINESKRRYSLESDLNYYIDINDYGITSLLENNDPAHFDSLSMILLGELYGREISKIID